jgi:transcriptional regulator GlxA family with amidase domain
MICNQRLARAHALLLDASRQHRAIAQIAADAGLQPGAHFSRLFGARYGRTPRDVRSGTATATVSA